MKRITGHYCQSLFPCGFQYPSVSRPEHSGKADLIPVFKSRLFQVNHVSPPDITQVAKKCITVCGQSNVAGLPRQGSTYGVTHCPAEYAGRCSFCDHRRNMSPGNLQLCNWGHLAQARERPSCLPPRNGTTGSSPTL